jgi:hypothetical protein
MEATNAFIDFRGWFKKKYMYSGMGERWYTFQVALNWHSRAGGKSIVEAGTMRSDLWSDGRSSYVFGDYCSRNNGRLWTVDIDPKAVETCRGLTSEFSKFITYEVGDSIEFLKKVDWPVDLLYLDSADYDRRCPEVSQKHNLAEFEAVLGRLTPNACVMLDDNCEDGGGKGELTKPRLVHEGFVCLLDVHGSVWVRP